jgi:sugar/nucleoside kinase (ribokinase family)
MTMSDSFCVDRYRDEFLELMRSKTVDIVFANRAEVLALYQTSDFNMALDLLSEDCALAAVTMSEEGSVILSDERRIPVRPLVVDRVTDTTGAGDLYAAGFLFGYTHGFELGDCGRLGSLAAGLVIQQIGPRVQTSLKQAAIEAGFIL